MLFCSIPAIHFRDDACMNQWGGVLWHLARAIVRVQHGEMLQYYPPSAPPCSKLLDDNQSQSGRRGKLDWTISISYS